jgi:hypothetical protein
MARLSWSYRPLTGDSLGRADWVAGGVLRQPRATAATSPTIRPRARRRENLKRADLGWFGPRRDGGGPNAFGRHLRQLCRFSRSGRHEPAVTLRPRRLPTHAPPGAIRTGSSTTGLRSSQDLQGQQAERPLIARRRVVTRDEPRTRQAQAQTTASDRRRDPRARAGSRGILGRRWLHARST